MSRSVSYFLDSGHWFLSLYNDDGEPQDVAFMARISSELTRNCPKGCSGHGECVLGKCECETGFDGPDCGQSKCTQMIRITDLARIPGFGRIFLYISCP